jgi:hypothetical protein
MRPRGARSVPSGIATSIPLGTVSDEKAVRDCRGRHRWRVVAFSVRLRNLTEKCIACGRERTKAW